MNGAVQGAQTFASALTSNADTTWYAATNGTAWETGLLTRTSATVFARTTIFRSTNANAAVNFSTGTIDVFCDVPGSKAKALERLTWGASSLSVAGSLIPLALLDISGAAAGQVAFPATQNAAAGANVLDDYEEGTFTPGISFGGGTTGLTYTTRLGSYLKIGRGVWITGRMLLSAKGSSTGQASITGNPFTAASSSVSYSYNFSYADGMVFTGMLILNTFNGSTGDFYQTNGGTIGALTHTAFTNASNIQYSGFIEAAT
jgi:hypothetical protein